MPTDFCVIGHRGCAGHAPENTLAACEQALSLGLSDVELDVRLTRDGELVLFHDDALENKTPLRGRPEDHVAADLLEVDLGRWFDRARGLRGVRFAGEPLTTLGCVFQRFGGALRYHLELKGPQPELVDRVLEVCREAAGVRFVLTSFAFDRLVRARERGAAVCWLVRDAPVTLGSLPVVQREVVRARQRGCVERAADAGFESVGLRAAATTREAVAHAASRGLSVRSWGVDTDADLEAALAAGVSGMTVDWPLEALRRTRGSARRLRGGSEE